ncbi:MAG TPA: DNA-binding protein [Oxalobacteraceae bacterium]|nr:DNA-binding protein [Oxalobacteraceae bacterium]
MKTLLDEKQVSKIINISVRTLQHYRLTGGGPVYFRIGKHVRYHPDMLIKFIMNCARE